MFSRQNNFLPSFHFLNYICKNLNVHEYPKSNNNFVLTLIIFRHRRMYNNTLQRKGVYQHLWQLSLQLRGRLSIGRRRLCRYVENICLIEIFATFLLSARLACTDVDECVENAPCKENCINTVGSYRCSCSQGFRPRVDDCIGKYGRL